MAALLKNGVPVGSSCGGEGVCTKCLITINEGMENLSLENEREVELRQNYSFAKDQRVSCQATLSGNITVDADYW